MITDTCKDPEEVIYKGPCEQLFECDPSEVEPETVLCSVPVETGGNIYGSQEKWCDKGIWKYTDCVACSPEICDGLDNDCDADVDEQVEHELAEARLVDARAPKDRRDAQPLLDAAEGIATAGTPLMAAIHTGVHLSHLSPEQVRLFHAVVQEAVDSVLVIRCMSGLGIRLYEQT